MVLVRSGGVPRQANAARPAITMVLTIALLVHPSCATAVPVERQTVEVRRTIERNGDAYTQGLVWHRGKLFESTGQYGESTLRRVDAGTGREESRRALSPLLFGEGLARIDERLIQLTWRSGVAIVYEIDSFDEVERYSYEGQGWGLCYDGRRLVMSDGSDRLTFRDAETFVVVGDVRVTLEGQPLARINELECVEGWIYANVYQTDWIVRIEPETGVVHSVIDASGLLSGSEREGVDVLNGIAFDPESEVFYLTGKYWPRIFAVRFVPTPGR